jgi:uncharacterized damage-inducible protein DinB
MSVTAFYANWARYNELLTQHIRGLGAADLALQAPAGDHWPIWAIVGHTAGTRIFWLCQILGEPGAETTPFTDPSGFGWEDDLETPRSATELVDALTSTWAIVAASLERWTPAMLDEAKPRKTTGGLRYHTRQSILLRMITHDAYHAGEIALIEGMHGRPQLDLWPPGAHTVEREG